MFSLRRMLAIALLVLWGPVTLHCGLEVDGLFGLVATNSAKAASPPAPFAPDTDPDGCGAIENGHFESLPCWFVVTAPAANAWMIRPDFVEPKLPVMPPLSSAPCWPSVEWVPKWAFQRRAASSPRAPGFIS